MPIRYFIITLGLLAGEYSRPELLAALKDLRELIQVGGFAPKLYGVTASGAILEFNPADRSWSAPLAQHPLGAQPQAPAEADQIAAAMAKALAART